MPSNTRLQNDSLTQPAIWRGRDPNYPGVPVPDEPPPVVKTTTSARGLDLDNYVFRYTARQRLHAFMLALGAALTITAVYYLDGPAQGIAISIAIGLIIAGGAAFLIMAHAHATYTRLAISTTHTYADPRPAPPQGERPFVPSSNRPATIKVGRFPISPPLLAALIDTAAPNDWRLTRDAATSVLPRNLYRDWQSTVGELQRLGYLDAEARPTAAAWAFIGRRPPLPQTDSTPPRAQSTHARRTHGAHEAIETVEEWGGAGA